MAIVRVSPELIEHWLFKGLNVRIIGGVYRQSNAAYDDGWFEFEIEGEEVPAHDQQGQAVSEVYVTHIEHNSPGADPYTTVEIGPAQRVPRGKNLLGEPKESSQELGEHAVG